MINNSLAPIQIEYRPYNTDEKITLSRKHSGRTNISEITYWDRNLRTFTIGEMSKGGEIYLNDLLSLKNLLACPEYQRALERVYLVDYPLIYTDNVQGVIKTGDYNGKILKKIYKDQASPNSDVFASYYDRLISTIKKELSEFNIKLEITDKIKNYLINKIYEYDKSDPIANALSKFDKRIVYTQLNPIFGQYYDGAVDLRQYLDLEVAKILSDFNINITKQNIDTFDATIKKIMRELNIGHVGLNFGAGDVFSASSSVGSVC